MSTTDTATGLHTISCAECGEFDYLTAREMAATEESNCEACGAAGAIWHAEDCTCNRRESTR
ncbi:MAG: hypothetical protein OXD34_14010 [bacterium]|nr:hypothetical protein [bacterium]